jgi:hypothetical protein
MKRGLAVLLLLGILLILPFVQAQTYSGFDRFTDNFKLFFSFGDNKVRMVLEIREKEINSAMENFKNGYEKDSSKNLEKAWKQLQIVQKKVSPNTAEEVRESVSAIMILINKEENLSKEFDVYILEEEKTGLTAEWVIEVNGKEGQTLTNEVVVNESEGQNRTNEIEMRIDEIDGEISNWVVDNDVKGENGDDGLVPFVKTEVANGDNGLKPEVKMYVKGDGTLKDDSLPEPDLNKINPDLYDPDARAPGDTIDETYDDEMVEGENIAGDEDEVIEGSAGTNEVAVAVDSNEGD